MYCTGSGGKGARCLVRYSYQATYSRSSGKRCNIQSRRLWTRRRHLSVPLRCPQYHLEQSLKAGLRWGNVGACIATTAINNRNHGHQAFAATISYVSVADEAPFRCGSSQGPLYRHQVPRPNPQSSEVPHPAPRSRLSVTGVMPRKDAIK